MRQLAYLLLPVILVLLFLRTRLDIREYREFKKLVSSQARQQIYRKWTFELFLLFGCGSLLMLFALGYAEIVLRPLAELSFIIPEEAKMSMASTGDGQASFLAGVLTSALVVGIVGGILIQRKTKRQHNHTKLNSQAFIVGDVQAMLPRNRQEARWVTLLALNAGFSEELFFRLLMPVLIYLVTGSALAALGGSVLVFGLVHYYQGWIGVLATTMMGVFLSYVYLSTGQIWIAMLLHAAIDLNGLIARPRLRALWSR